jgi:tRNA threonylcarbamoyladenosine biosynthesis protein TsaE
MHRINSKSAEQTETVGKDLAARLKPGDVLTLTGDLGSGKTVFVRGLAKGLGCEGLQVTSPTFALVHEYRCQKLSLCHIDAYRLDGAEQLWQTGFFDYLERGWAVAVEWGERVISPLEADFAIEISRIGEFGREILIKGRGI